MKNLSFLGYPNYCVTKDGRVYSSLSQRFLKQSSNQYKTVTLVNEDGKKNFHVHRLVALAYVFNPDLANKTQVNHIDGDKYNNNVANLEWVTPQENTQHAIETGLRNHSLPPAPRLFGDELAHKVCMLMEEGFRVQDIEQMLNVPRYFINKIRSKESYQEISEQYDFSKVLKKQRISTDKVVKICDFLQEGVSMAEIKRRLNVNLTTVRRIKRRETHIAISRDYKW